MASIKQRLDALESEQAKQAVEIASILSVVKESPYELEPAEKPQEPANQPKESAS